MNKFDIVVADPAWSFDDKLTMSDTKRGAEANYPVLSVEEIKKLPVKDIISDNSLLVLWVPSSLLQDGLDTMNAWGFAQKQTVIWIKVKKKCSDIPATHYPDSLDSVLGFGMGRLFRQTHELALVGVRGKIYSQLENKSQRSVHFDINLGHSTKPEKLQKSLELMFPSASKIELFGRRSRNGWVVLGNESPESFGLDIRDSLQKIIEQQNASHITA